MPKYIDAIDVDELIRRTEELEAVALEQVAKYAPSIDPVMWNRWTAIAKERTAFKYDLIDAPIVDAVEVVRCKNCVYYNAREGFCEYLSNNYAPAVDMEENDFCSKGKRREDE